MNRFKKIVDEISKMSVFEKKNISEISVNEILILAKFEKNNIISIEELQKDFIGNFCSRAQLYRYIEKLKKLNYLRIAKDNKHYLIRLF